MRLTNNEEDYRKDYSLVGDRTLAVFLLQRDYNFATYNLGTTDRELNANIKKSIQFGKTLGLWTYIYFGYSWDKRVANAYIKFPDSSEKVVIEDARHMIPKYLAFLVGADGFNKGWNGNI